MKKGSKLILYQCVCRWVEGDALDLPFVDCKFDAVTMGYGLRNVVDRHRAMREIYRVLKPGLRLFVYLHFSQGFCAMLSCLMLVFRFKSVHT